MALRPYIGFVGPSYTSQSRIAAYDRTVNWYPERIESGTGNAQARYWLAPTPGYAVHCTMPTEVGRVIFSINGVYYAIGGSALYDVTNDPPILRAQGLSDEEPGGVAQIVSNGDAGHQLLFRADTTLYALDLNAPISEETLLDPPSAAPSGFVNVDGVDVQDMARTTLGNYKRSNVKIADLPTDPALTMSNRGIYNIITNQGG